MTSIPYDRQSSFALFSAENPTSQQSGAALDAEFIAVKIALDDTQQNLAKIQDDDGVLARGSVGQAQFDSSVSLGFAAPKQWAAGITWDANISTCFYQSKFYICTATHVSGVSFDSSKWSQIADFTTSAIISDGSITSAKLAAGAVGSDKISDGSISSVKLATGAVGTSKLTDSAVTFQKLNSADIRFPLANLLLPVGLGPLPWSRPSLPTGWDWADGGALLAGTAFPALRQAYMDDGFPFGSDGSGNPKKPDMRGRVPAGVDNFGLTGDAGRLANSSATTSRTSLGGTGGSGTVTLTTAQMPSHYHSASIYDPTHVHNFTAVAGSEQKPNSGGNPAYINSTTASTSASATGVQVTSSNGLGTTYSAGGDGYHDNLQPTLLVGYIIKAH